MDSAAQEGATQVGDAGKPVEDKRLERLYDYTKFHIGIYLSAAGGVATLLASKDADWIISRLVGNQWLMYLALALLILAGMCGGIVATGITEYRTFDDFWTKNHSPATFPRWKATGRSWVAREHGLFWASLLVLVLAIVPSPFTRETGKASTSARDCPCWRHE